MQSDKDSQPAEIRGPGIGARLRGYFLAGILVSAPIGITVMLA